MRKLSLALALGVTILPSCSQSKPLTDAERVQLVRSIMHPKSTCVENTGGMLISCAAGNQGGTLSTYIKSADKQVIHVDVKMSVSASTGVMAAVWGITRETVGKLGLEGDDYQQCTDINAQKRTTSSHTLNAYKLECTSYARMMNLNVDMVFSPR